MKAEIFSVKYADKDAAAIVYKKITEVAADMGIIAYGLESYKTTSRRSRTNFRLNLVLNKEDAMNLPSILKVIHNLLSDHPLFPHLILNYTAVPISQKKWNFGSYDDPNYQKIFIRKREKG